MRQQPGMDRDALRLSHPLHGAAQSERVGSAGSRPGRSRTRPAATWAAGRCAGPARLGAVGGAGPGWGCRRAVARSPAAPAVRRDRLVTWTTAIAGSALLDPRGLDGPLEGQPGPAQHVDERAEATRTRMPAPRTTTGGQRAAQPPTASTSPTAAAPTPKRVTGSRASRSGIRALAQQGSGDRHRLEGPGHHILRGAALDLGIRAEDHPVGQGGLGHRLDVLGGDVRAPGGGRDHPGRPQQGQPAAGRDTEADLRQASGVGSRWRRCSSRSPGPLRPSA